MLISGLKTHKETSFLKLVRDLAVWMVLGKLFHHLGTVNENLFESDFVHFFYGIL